jgi:hypothetical protein
MDKLGPILFGTYPFLLGIGWFAWLRWTWWREDRDRRSGVHHGQHRADDKLT